MAEEVVEAIPTGEAKPGVFRRAGRAIKRALPGGEPIAGGRIQSGIRKYLSNTQMGVDRSAKRASTDYQQTVTERLRSLMAEEEVERGERDFMALGRTFGQLAETPVDMGLAEAPPAAPMQPGAAISTTSTRDPATAAISRPGSVEAVLNFPGDRIPRVTGQNWREYRDAQLKALKDQGVNPRQIVAFERGFTEYQQEKFDELGRSAYQALEMGNTTAAMKLMNAAYQWMPTDNDVEFEMRDGKLIGVFRDDETNEVVGAQEFKAQDVLGMLERMKDPKAWYTFTSDRDAKRRGEILESMDREIDAAQLEINARNAEANLRNAEAYATGAGRGGAGRPVSDLQTTDIAKMLEDALQRGIMEDNPLLANDADKAAVLSMTDRMIRHGAAPADALNTVLKYWGQPNLEEDLIAVGLLPAPGPRTGGGFRDGGSVRRYADGGTPRRPTDPKVGPADPATRRRLIEKHIAEGKAEKLGQRQPAARPPAPQKREFSRAITGGARQAIIDQHTTDMQRGIPVDPKRR